MEMNRITRKVLSTVIVTLFLATSAFFAAAQGPSATTLVVGHPIDPPGLNPLGHNSAIFESVRPRLSRSSSIPTPTLPRSCRV